MKVKFIAKYCKYCLVVASVPDSFDFTFCFHRPLSIKLLLCTLGRQGKAISLIMSLVLNWNAARSRFIIMAVLHIIVICELAYYYFILFFVLFFSAYNFSYCLLIFLAYDIIYI